MNATMPNMPRFMTNGSSAVNVQKVKEVEECVLPAFVNEFGIKTIKEPSCGWRLACIYIPPKLAEAMLACRDEEHQRRIRPGSVAFYQKQMESRQWMLTHQGIAFDKFGRLIDGQHRLESGVLSDETFPSLVWFGVGKGDEAALIDHGATRNVQDTMAFSGQKRSTVYTSIMRQARYTNSSTPERLSNLEIQKFEEMYRPAFEFAAGIHGIPVAMAAAIARAWFHIDPATLADFADVFKEINPAVRKQDRAIVILRKRYGQMLVGKMLGAQTGRNELMAKSMRAIRAFSDKEAISTLYAADMSDFPLPADGKPRRESSLV